MLLDYENFYYHKASQEESWQDNRSRRVKIIDFIVKNHQIDDSILEVGCGTGTIVKHLPKDVNYVGIDSSSLAIKKAREFGRGKNVDFFYSRDQERINFPDQFFNFVISVFTLEHFKSPQKMLDEMVRVLKKEGYLILLAPNLELPFSFPNAIRHKSYLYKIRFTLLRLKDYFLRLIGNYKFRTVDGNFSETTGKYEKPDDDLIYVVSSFEVINYLKQKHNLKSIFENILGSISGLKNQIRKLVTFLPGMNYYGDLLFIIMQK